MTGSARLALQEDRFVFARVGVKVETVDMPIGALEGEEERAEQKSCSCQEDRLSILVIGLKWTKKLQGADRGIRHMSILLFRNNIICEPLRPTSRFW